MQRNKIANGRPVGIKGSNLGGSGVKGASSATILVVFLALTWRLPAICNSVPGDLDAFWPPQEVGYRTHKTVEEELKKLSEYPPRNGKTHETWRQSRVFSQEETGFTRITCKDRPRIICGENTFACPQASQENLHPVPSSSSPLASDSPKLLHFQWPRATHRRAKCRSSHCHQTHTRH